MLTLALVIFLRLKPTSRGARHHCGHPVLGHPVLDRQGKKQPYCRVCGGRDRGGVEHPTTCETDKPIQNLHTVGKHCRRSGRALPEFYDCGNAQVWTIFEMQHPERARRAQRCVQTNHASPSERVPRCTSRQYSREQVAYMTSNSHDYCVRHRWGFLLVRLDSRTILGNFLASSF